MLPRLCEPSEFALELLSFFHFLNHFLFPIHVLAFLSGGLQAAGGGWKLVVVVGLLGCTSGVYDIFRSIGCWPEPGWHDTTLGGGSNV